MNKRFAGVDIGSRTIELVVIDSSGELLHRDKADTGHNPRGAVKELLSGAEFDQLMATGYGRGMLEVELDCNTTTEIKAHAVGAKHCFPEAASIIDIGGQDSKVISLFPNGRIRKFEMNDRCAAGTGKFLEIMARTLGYTLSEFGEAALATTQNCEISSMCTVFAESEVTSLISAGKDRGEISRGLHLSVIKRAVGMIRRVNCSGNIVFTGGVARNEAMVSLLAEATGHPVMVPEFPEYTGALGTAISGKLQVEQ